MWLRRLRLQRIANVAITLLRVVVETEAVGACTARDRLADMVIPKSYLPQPHVAAGSLPVASIVHGAATTVTKLTRLELRVRFTCGPAGHALTQTPPCPWPTRV